MKVEINFTYKADLVVKMHTAIVKALYGVGLDFVREAAPRTPVDTGNLVNSYVVKVDRNDYFVEITNTANYAAAVEFGHLIGKGPKKVKGQRFMRSALYENIDRWKKTLADITKEDL